MLETSKGCVAQADAWVPAPDPVCEMPPRLSRLREALLDAPYSLCSQKAELLTQWFRTHDPGPPLTRLLAPWHFALMRGAMTRNLAEGQPQTRLQLRASTALQRLYRGLDRDGEPLVVRFARGLAHVLEQMALTVYDDELIVGNLSSQRIGAPIHPDFGGVLLLPELRSLATRRVNPLRTSEEQIRRLEEEIFPYWFTRSVMARTPLHSSDPTLANTLVRGRDFLLTQFAGISHVTPDYPAVLSKGFTGILGDIEAARRRAPDAESQAFYQAAAICAQAAIRYGARWSRHLRAQSARQSDPARAAELADLAGIFERVPARPARSFHEALQSLFIAHVMVHQESFQHGVSFGRIDQYLYPYYARDVQAGALTRERAVELLGCFLGKAAEQLPLFNAMATEFFSGLSSASGLTLGGSDASGRDASNELTGTILQAYDFMRLRQPNLHLRLHDGSPLELRHLAMETLKKGGGMPGLFNDATIVPALERGGATSQDASDYAIVGCVEWGVPYKSFPAAGAAFVSLPAILDDVLHGRDAAAAGDQSSGRLHGGVASARFADMDALWAALREAMAARIRHAVDGNESIEAAHRLYRPTPMLSLIVGGCVESGRDVTAGGAHYDSTGMQGVGLADVADSLAAIERVVFEEKRASFSELVAAVDADFDGHEALRSRLQLKVAKYGEDVGAAERWAERVASAWCELVAGHRSGRGGNYAAGFWTMTTHVGFGRRLGALPSGRRRGQPLSDGISPTNGSDRRGPTASLAAAARVCGNGVANGLALNEKLDPWFVAGEAGTRMMDDLTRGYFRCGGQQVQYNVLDAATLLDAKLHPERHRGLVVRISGYSAYFNDLTDEMKDDIIARTAHAGPPSSCASGPVCQMPPRDSQ
ncbi:MAG: hypothetical protein HY899_00615 [Deltaproteobacteria bacterium]|nr:hypothetical protein [Deltaproteobacteria bacterium]